MDAGGHDGGVLPRRVAVAALVACLSGLTACSGSPTPSPTRRAEGPVTPTTYAAHALDLVGSGLAIDPVTWPAVRGNALERAAKTATTAGTYPALRDALAAGGQNRADFIAPGDAARVPASRHEPTVSTSDGISVVTLPGFVDLTARPGSGTTTDAELAYARGGSAAVANAARDTRCGWVVDVRGNGSTDVPVLLGSIASLLPSGRTLVETDRTGATVTLGLGDAAVTLDGREVLSLDPVARHDDPVAVLQDSGTSRAGEAVVLAFRGRDRSRSYGQPTFGRAVDGTVERLSDGASVVVIRWRMGARSGPPVTGAIAPEVPVDGPDDQLAAARDWLASQCP